MLHAAGRLAPLLAATLLLACGDDGTTVIPPDLTAHCDYQAMGSNADVGTVVTVAPLTAGAAEVAMDVPVGTALGGYTARAGFLGNAGVVERSQGLVPHALGRKRQTFAHSGRIGLERAAK
mgnify:CR=1 FL=1